MTPYSDKADLNQHGARPEPFGWRGARADKDRTGTGSIDLASLKRLYNDQKHRYSEANLGLRLLHQSINLLYSSYWQLRNANDGDPGD
jgi:hypothetical protein